jgi:two-component system nitrogen regulation response regulator GlnG
VATSGDSDGAASRDDATLLPCDLKRHVDQRLAAQSTNLYAESLEMMERYLLSEVLSVAEGNQSEAARSLGITRGSLRHKIRLLGISIQSKVEFDESRPL